ncbi:MAG TPA: hypothetical protein DE036_00365 [Actinobacteria bacterium]|nr:hypothetical protein [Actinomycetota bacterium]
MNTSTDDITTAKRSLIVNPHFWYIVVLLVLITLHHYDDQTGITIFAVPDRIIGLTRHAIDRMLYLIPIIMGGFYFGSRGGYATMAVALAAMMPRALVISGSQGNAISEMIIVGLIGALLSMRLDYYHKQGEELEVVTERLQTTQRRLHSKVRMSMEQAKQLSVINSFSSILNQSLEIHQVTHISTKMVKEVIQVEIVLVFRLEETTQRLRIMAHEGISEKSVEALDGMKLGEGLCGCVAQTGEPLIIEDIAANEKLCTTTIINEDIKSQLSVPLAAKDKIIGTLCVATRTRRQFKEPEIQLLSALGNLIAIAIENSELNKGRKSAAEQVKLSEKRYRQLFENAHDAIWVQDLSGTITAANEATADIFGYASSELPGTDIKHVLSGQGLKVAKDLQNKLLRGEQTHQPYTQNLIRKDGKEIVLRLTTNLISSNGHASGLQFIGRDITNELRMQENQRFYLEQITKAHEDERLRISRDLHDSTAQNLIAAINQLEDFCHTDQYLPMPKLQALLGLYDQLKDVLQEIRQVSRDLRPSIIDQLGLLPAVEWLVEQQKAEHGLDASLSIKGEERRFSEEQEVTLFRIIQEALRNVVRHAEATEVRVAIVFKETETVVSIIDNGSGFELPESLGELSRLGKLGVDGMMTRTRLVGGTFDMQSSPGEGTAIVIVVPE